MMTTKRMSFFASLSWLVSFGNPVAGFSHPSRHRSVVPHTPEASTQRSERPLFALRTAATSPNFLLKEFEIHSGEGPVNPYQVLHVPRSASRAEIRQKFNRLSRRYHPDTMHQRRRIFLGGRDTDPKDVKAEWERIQFAYGILKNPNLRHRYDRNEMLSDPGAALGRMALGVLGKGISDVGKGLAVVGAFTLEHVAKATDHVVREAVIPALTQAVEQMMEGTDENRTSRTTIQLPSTDARQRSTIHLGSPESLKIQRSARHPEKQGTFQRSTIVLNRSELQQQSAEDVVMTRKNTVLGLNFDNKIDFMNMISYSEEEKHGQGEPKGIVSLSQGFLQQLRGLVTSTEKTWRATRPL